MILPETGQRTKNTNPVVYEQASSLERFESASNLTDHSGFITKTWRVFITTLASEVHNIFASLKALKSAWQPGDIKLTLRQAFDDNPGFIPFNGEDVLKADFPDLCGAIGGEGHTSDETTIRLPKSAGRVLKVSGLTDPTANENPDVYSGELPLLDRYSTSETRTNKVWIDGKRIYRKVIACGALPNATQTTDAHGISNLGAVVRMYGYATDGSYWIPLPHSGVVSDNDDIRLIADATNVYIKTAHNWISYNGWVVLEYTKSTDSSLPRGPETLRIRTLLKT